MMFLMMHQPHLHQPWRLDRCNPFIHSLAAIFSGRMGYYLTRPPLQLIICTPGALYRVSSGYGTHASAVTGCLPFLHTHATQTSWRQLLATLVTCCAGNSPQTLGGVRANQAVPPAPPHSICRAACRLSLRVWYSAHVRTQGAWHLPRRRKIFYFAQSSNPNRLGHTGGMVC